MRFNAYQEVLEVFHGASWFPGSFRAFSKALQSISGIFRRFQRGLRGFDSLSSELYESFMGGGSKTFQGVSMRFRRFRFFGV